MKSSNKKTSSGGSESAHREQVLDLVVEVAANLLDLYRAVVADAEG